MESRSRSLPSCCAISSLLLAAWLLAGCEPAGPAFHGQEVSPPQPAPELTGVNWDGAPFQLDRLRGKVAILFFGYTYCPDVCPFTLAKMKQLVIRLGDEADGLAVVFVSVDPHRDTVEKLASYVPGFDRRFYGVHLEPDQLDAVKEALGLTVQYGQPKEGPGTDSFYYVDHTGTYFVIDRQGRLRLKFPPDATVDEMAPDVEALLASEPSALAVRDARAQITGATGAIYLVIDNPRAQGDRLLAVTTPWAGAAELHETREEAGVMRMVHHPEGFEVPARGSLELAPGGKHVMLMEPRLPAGGEEATLPLTLRFEQAGELEIEARVTRAPQMAHEMTGHEMRGSEH